MGTSKNKATVREIAKKANVSTATISRAFNGSGIVKAETYNAIMEAAASLGYEFKKGAQAEIAATKKKTKNRLILISIPSMSNPFYSEIIKGIQSSANNNDFDFLLFTDDIKESTLEHFLSFITYLDIAGLITMNLASENILKSLAEYVPVVQCSEFIESPYASSVGINDYSATQYAMDYFLSMGRNRIGFINGPLNFKYSQNRLAAFKSIAQDAKLDLPSNWIIQLPDLNPDMAFSSIVKLLSLPDAPDCFFAVSDVLAAAAIRAAQYCNFRVPEDILVMGFDNTIISQLTTPSITTINQPKFQLGFLAGELLIEKINNPLSEVKHMKLNTELIIRESTTSIF